MEINKDSFKKTRETNNDNRPQGGSFIGHLGIGKQHNYKAVGNYIHRKWR